MARGYNQSAGPKEGKSAVSAQTRQRVFGGGGDGIRGGSTGSAYSEGNDYDQFRNSFGEGDFGRLLMQLLAQGGLQQDSAADFIRAKAETRDPVGWAIKQGEAGNITRNANPWGEGGAFEGRRAADVMTPEEIMASQGNTAANQWASKRAGITPAQKQAGEFDPDQLRQLNAMRQRSYYG